KDNAMVQNGAGRSCSASDVFQAAEKSDAARVELTRQWKDVTCHDLRSSKSEESFWRGAAVCKECHQAKRFRAQSPSAVPSVLVGGQSSWSLGNMPSTFSAGMRSLSSTAASSRSSPAHHQFSCSLLLQRGRRWRP